LSAGFDPGLGKALARALDGQNNLDEVGKGDMFRVVAQEVTALGQFSRYAGVEALEFLRATPNKPPLRVYYFDYNGTRGYYDAQGRGPHEGGWRKPIKDARVTSPFNLKRLHPVLKKIMPHLGTDLGAAAGTPVGAAAPGLVSFIGWGGPSGNLVKIQHPNGIETGYAHLSKFVDGLKVGVLVRRLQIVGYVGSTGRSTGPHLHFSASKNGQFIDAESLNLDGMRTLKREEREAFLQVTRKYDSLLDGISLPEADPTAEPLGPTPPEPAASADPRETETAHAASDPSLEEDGEGAPEDDAHAHSVAAPGSKVPAGAPPPHNSVYITDKELLRMQGASDDGEVAE
jgi:murein DD-endopeptidase MepM/ murein hydrolase activator NlpD